MCTVCGLGISVCSAAPAPDAMSSALPTIQDIIADLVMVKPPRAGEPSLLRRARRSNHALRWLPFLPRRGGHGKDQRLDHDRHRAGVRQHGADVDVVELLELETVDRDDGVVELHLL